MSKSQPRRLVATPPFFSINPDCGALFTVRAGIPTLDALETASCFLVAAREAVNTCNEDAHDPGVNAAIYLLEMAAAVLDAGIHSLMQEEGHD